MSPSMRFAVPVTARPALQSRPEWAAWWSAAAPSRGNTRCSIIGPATLRSLDDGLVGEIWVSGRSVAAGYYNRPELTGEVFHARLPERIDAVSCTRDTLAQHGCGVVCDV
jgi:non-ribosomal peptide synthetase component F